MHDTSSKGFLHCIAYLKNIRTWLIEIQQSDWLVSVILNSLDHTVENHVLKTVDNGLIKNVLAHPRKNHLRLDT